MPSGRRLWGCQIRPDIRRLLTWMSKHVTTLLRASTSCINVVIEFSSSQYLELQIEALGLKYSKNRFDQSIHRREATSYYINIMMEFSSSRYQELDIETPGLKH